MLIRLKTHGPQSAAAVGKALGISGEAARQHLARLAVDDLVEARAAVSGVGRPTKMWQLTAAGHRRFPDTHGVLTVQLLESIRRKLGDSALDELIEERDAQTYRIYSKALPTRGSLAGRVAKLAEIRTREGYMCEWRQEPDGAFLLVENHCPICAAASSCQRLCQAELVLFRRILGPRVSVQRVEHIQSGDRRCSYRIARLP